MKKFYHLGSWSGDILAKQHTVQTLSRLVQHRNKSVIGAVSSFRLNYSASNSVVFIPDFF